MNRTASTLEPGDVQESAESLLLRCGQVCANYGPIQVCFGINISISPKEIIAVLGPNGAGKSSFLGALAGIVSNRGSVRLGECELMGLPPHRRAHAGLAFVPEVRGNIFPALSVEENLRLPLQWLARTRCTPGITALEARPRFCVSSRPSGLTCEKKCTIFFQS